MLNINWMGNLAMSKFQNVSELIRLIIKVNSIAWLYRDNKNK